MKIHDETRSFPFKNDYFRRKFNYEYEEIRSSRDVARTRGIIKRFLFENKSRRHGVRICSCTGPAKECSILSTLNSSNTDDRLTIDRTVDVRKQLFEHRWFLPFDCRWRISQFTRLDQQQDEITRILTLVLIGHFDHQFIADGTMDETFSFEFSRKIRFILGPGVPACSRSKMIDNFRIHSDSTPLGQTSEGENEEQHSTLILVGRRRIKWPANNIQLSFHSRWNFHSRRKSKWCNDVTGVLSSPFFDVKQRIGAPVSRQL